MDGIYVAYLELSQSSSLSSMALHFTNQRLNICLKLNQGSETFSCIDIQTCFFLSDQNPVGYASSFFTI